MMPSLLDALPAGCTLNRNPFLMEHDIDTMSTLVVPPLLPSSAADDNLFSTRAITSNTVEDGEKVLAAATANTVSSSNRDSNTTSVVRGLELLRLRQAARVILAEEALRGHEMGAAKEAAPNFDDPPSAVAATASFTSIQQPGQQHPSPGSQESSATHRNYLLAGVSPSFYASALAKTVPPVHQPMAPPHQHRPSIMNLNATTTTRKISRTSGGGQQYNHKHLHPLPPELPIAELEVLARLTNPPMPVVAAFAATRVLLSQNIHVLPNFGSLKPQALRAILRKPNSLLRQLDRFDITAPVRYDGQ
jgi:hypothetical protein